MLHLIFIGLGDLHPTGESGGSHDGIAVIY